MMRIKAALTAAVAVCGFAGSASLSRADEPVASETLLVAPQIKADAPAAKPAAAPQSCSVGTCCNPLFVPNMIGDGLGIPVTAFPPAPPGLLLYPSFFARVGENHNVLPQDRASLSYGYYDSFRAVVGSGGSDRDVDLHDFKFTFEKTFACGRASAEVILPFAYTLDSDQEWSQAGYCARAVEFGNVAFGLKALLWERESAAISAGLLVEAPTANDVVFTSALAGQGRLSNDAWYFTPYLGARMTRGDNFFAHAFASYRMPTADNRQFFNGVGVDGQDYDVQDLLMLDGGVGYWLRRQDCGRVRGIAPTIELHYATTTTDSREAFNGFTINRVDSLNLTAGVTALVGERGTVALGVNIPLNDNDSPGFGPTDRAVDWSLGVQVNLFFGGRR